MASLKESQLIDKLNDHNYATWKFKITMLLIKNDLEEYISQEPPDPITADWRKNDKKARALINLFIEDSQILHIKNLTTAKATFDALKEIHERSNLCSKLFLLRKLYSSKLNESGNMIVHLNKIFEIIDKLNSIGEHIDDSHIAAILLCSLPSSFDTLVVALEARPEPELTSGFIRNKLVDEYNRRSESSAQKDNATKAFNINKGEQSYTNNYARNNVKKDLNFKKYTTKKENKFCVYCKKTNHFKSDCWHLKNKNSNYKKNSNEHKSAFCSDRRDHSGHNASSAHQIEKVTKEFDEFALSASNTEQNVWILDSGSSSHICNDRTLFHKIYDVNKSKVVVANGQSLTAQFSGDIKMSTVEYDNKINNILLRNVLYVPDIKVNLLSVKKATEYGGTVVFQKDKCNITYNGKTYLTGHLKNNLYEVNFMNPGYEHYVNTVKECKNVNCLELWHKRMGHRNLDSINQIINKNLAIGCKIDKCSHRVDCETCIQSKMTSKPYPKQAEHRATKVLELIHSDVCGPIKTPTIGGKSYFVTFIDDFSRYTTIYLLSHKNEVFEKLKEFVAFTKNKFGRIPQELRSDNGGEYTSREMDDYLKSMGIKPQLTVPRSAPQNGVAERKNRSLIEMAKCMLNEANLPHRFWGEAISTATYLQNRLPTKANDKTPFELWEKYRPNLSHLKIFGCKVYAYVDKTNRTKLENTGQPGIFTGYDNKSKGYRIYTGGKNIIISRSAKFLEHIIPYKDSQKEINFDESQHDPDQNHTERIEIDLDPLIENESLPTLDNDNDVEQPRRSERSNKGVPPDRLIYLTKHEPIYEPKDWSDVQNLHNPNEKTNWLNATKNEFDSLQLNKTWTLVDPPQGKNIIGCRWTFKAKYNSDGEIQQYKARLVAKGYSQKYGEDYDETYASVVSHTTIRTLLAAASVKKLEVRHLDVKTAFLHGDLDEDIYMAQPEGYIKPGNENKVCKLQKAIYGLKQAARAWQTKIEKTLKNLRFIQSNADPCLYTRREGKNITYIVVYVDDILVAGNEKETVEIIRDLNKQFEIKDLGPIKYYLGIEIRKTSEGLYALNQGLKIKELINKFNLNDSKPTNTPMETGYIKAGDEGNLLPNNKNYRSAIGALLYIATITRPDILAPISILSRRNENPRKQDWEQVKKTIRYLKTTQNIELIIDPGRSPNLVCYSDADWAGDKKDRKSTSGNLFVLGKTPILWISKKQNCVALSSAEAEYIAAAHATQELLWLLKLLEDIDLKQQFPIKLYMDNQPAIKMIECPKYTSKTKHVDIKYHHIRNLKENNIIEIDYCPTDQMTADVLTKPLPAPGLVKHRNSMQLISKDVQ